MSNNSSSSSGGIGFVGLLTIAFIVLKLCNQIDWTWFWVLSPMIFSIGFVLFIFLFIGIWHLPKVIKSWKRQRDWKRKLNNNTDFNKLLNKVKDND